MELVYLVYYCDAVSLEAIFDEQIQENWQFPEQIYDFGLLAVTLGKQINQIFNIHIAIFQKILILLLLEQYIATKISILILQLDQNQ